MLSETSSVSLVIGFIFLTEFAGIFTCCEFLLAQISAPTATTGKRAYRRSARPLVSVFEDVSDVSPFLGYVFGKKIRIHVTTCTVCYPHTAIIVYV